MFNPRKSPVKGRGGILREGTIIVQMRFTNKSKHDGNRAAIARAIYDCLEARHITCEDVLFVEQDVNGKEMRDSWMAEELW